MTGKSPRSRLSKLFHKHNDAPASPKPDALNSSPPPAASANSPGDRRSLQHIRKVSSNTQMYLKDLNSKRQSRRISTDLDHLNNNATSSEAQATQPGAQIAAEKAMYPDKDMNLPVLPRQTDLSTDIGNLTLSEKTQAKRTASGRPYSEDVADRNIEGYPDTGANGGFTASDSTATRNESLIRPHRKSVGNAQPLIPDRDLHSEEVAARNSAPRQRGSADSHSLSRKQDVSDLRRSQDTRRSDVLNPNSSVGRPSQDKPLPNAPSSDQRGLEDASTIKHDSGVESELGKEKGYLLKDLEHPVALTNIVDLRNTEDTTLHERWAPAVTHEVVQQNVHHIREEVITREIHEHHIFHRVLPIIDIEVLPARHFTPVEGGYMELAEEEVPGRAGPNAQWMIAETVSKMMPKNAGQLPLRQFTARKFEGKDGDYKEYTGKDGIKRTETWWVHPPTMETGGMETGQTYPFYLGHPDPAQNGLRASLPAGNLVGVSPLLAKKQRERAAGLAAQKDQPLDRITAQAEMTPPAVPRHAGAVPKRDQPVDSSAYAGPAPPAVPSHSVGLAAQMDQPLSVSALGDSAPPAVPPHRTFPVGYREEGTGKMTPGKSFL